MYISKRQITHYKRFFCKRNDQLRTLFFYIHASFDPSWRLEIRRKGLSGKTVDPLSKDEIQITTHSLIMYKHRLCIYYHLTKENNLLQLKSTYICLSWFCPLTIARSEDTEKGKRIMKMRSYIHIYLFLMISLTTHVIAMDK